MSEPTPIGRLAALVGGRVVGADVTVGAVTHDSRLVTPGSLFVAIRGMHTDGHDHVAAAASAGAAAVAVEREVTPGLPQLVVPDTRAALAPLSAAVYGDPSARLRVVGVTGTNGKTTVTHILESMAAAAGIRFGLVGTVGARIAGTAVPVARTTPEASDLQRLLAAMVDAGVGSVAIEVSSHALELHRVDAVRFSTAAFTNLSQDHLDFHGDMDRYFAAKARLFEPPRAARAVICIDDEAGRALAAAVAIPVVTVSVGGGGDVAATVVDAGLQSTTVDLRAATFDARLRLPVTGRFNVANVALACAIAEAEGYPNDAIVAGAETAPVVPGRMEAIDEGQPFGVVVDYAHTPEAIATVVAAVRPLVTGRVLVVVGAGGDRDREKRPLMGRAAAAADVAFITSDNPRSEDPAAIVADVAEGAAAGPGTVIEEVDRRKAIAAALDAAHPGDVVLILGKGHETGQEHATGIEPFDDRVEARRALHALQAGNGAGR